MDIAKFNQILSSKIAKAKSYESHDDTDTAIKIWLEISDITLKASKQPNLDFSYRHMLITKTEQIMNHIKQLKAPKKKAEEKIISKEINSQELEIKNVKTELERIPNKSESDHSLKNIKKEITPNLDLENLSEKTNIKDTSDLFKEIDAPKDFKIVTPHDPKYVEKVKKLSENADMGIFKRNNENELKKNAVPADNKIICFACGAQLPPNSKVCTECGSKLS
jgi:hypothetical protein